MDKITAFFEEIKRQRVAFIGTGVSHTELIEKFCEKGIGVTVLLCIPLNLILHKLTGIETLSAVLPVRAAVILVLISMMLTLISGLIPAGIAARKDPVTALRTE